VFILSGRGKVQMPAGDGRERAVVRVVDQHSAASESRGAWLVSDTDIPPGYNFYLLHQDQQRRLGELPTEAGHIVLPDGFERVLDGDVLGFWTDGSIRNLYRRASRHNGFLVTERCNSYCLMCSQPPKDVDDSWIMDEIEEAIPLVHPSTGELGFTGGEPTLLGRRFIDVLKQCKTSLPSTAIHVLSNGRNFRDAALARAWGEVGHPDLMVGIPLYSDISDRHDYVVQADGAFDETIRGILNLKRENQKVEIRVVIHKQTYKDLPRLAEFLARNLLFIDHVALMGLEIMGFTRANLELLWIDPTEYQSELKRAARTLHRAGMRVSIYNHQLCLLDQDLWRFAVQSISDWKNEYIDECAKCSVQSQCGGFFSSAKYKRSPFIKAINFASAAEQSCA
jgi:His-Xaa-Ser system radical SAM maturase HxsC